MMATPAQLGICLRHNGPGEQRVPCPRCALEKRRKADDALAVRIKDDGGATWWCHRCQWRGGAGHERTPGWRPQRTVQAAPVDPEAARKAELALEVWRSGHPLC